MVQRGSSPIEVKPRGRVNLVRLHPDVYLLEEDGARALCALFALAPGGRRCARTCSCTVDPYLLQHAALGIRGREEIPYSSIIYAYSASCRKEGSGDTGWT